MARQLSVNNGAQGNYPSEQVDPLRLMAQLPIRPHHVIAAYRADSCHFAVPLGKHLFDGKVYAMVDDLKAQKWLQDKAAEIRLGNLVVLRKAQKDGVKLESLDGALIPFALYGAANRKAFLRKVARLLKQGAWAAVLEWQSKDTLDGPPIEQRIDEAGIVALGRETGFRFSERRDMGSQHFMVVLRK